MYPVYTQSCPLCQAIARQISSGKNIAKDKYRKIKHQIWYRIVGRKKGLSFLCLLLRFPPFRAFCVKKNVTYVSACTTAVLQKMDVRLESEEMIPLQVVGERAPVRAPNLLGSCSPCKKNF